MFCSTSTKYPTTIKDGVPIFERKGEHNGVSFQYISAFVNANKPKIVRVLSALWGWFVAPFYLYRHKITSGSNILLINLTRAHYIVYLKLIAAIVGFKLILMRSEYPRPIMEPSFSTKIYRLVLEKWIFKLFDGFILMTTALEQYFCKLKRDDVPTTLIPMSVDLSRFNIAPTKQFDFEYIAYAGSLSSQKDGLDVLLNAYNKVAAHDKEIRLVIIGDTSQKQHYQSLQTIVQKFPRKVINRIIFTGRIDKDQVPHYLMNAKILALARPDSIQAQGGFPTKLGEYLATGRPVVVTRTGEIPLYLHHGQNALLCEPGNVDDFANKLRWALENYDHACRIGANGRIIAETVFNSRIQAKKLSTFLEQF